MSGGITYEGAIGSPGTRPDGIFKGKSIWITHKVPQRDRFIDLIRKNGGRIMMLDKSADIIIGDPCRKDQPKGSLSFKWIEDSIANGIAQLEDRYVIDDKISAPTIVGRGRKMRAVFTSQEDATMVKYALGQSDRLGNRIWQIFEETHPRHTWQSWRNRFKTKYASLTTKQLQEIAARASEEEAAPQESAEEQQSEAHQAEQASTPKLPAPSPPKTQLRSPSLGASPRPRRTTRGGRSKRLEQTGFHESPKAKDTKRESPQGKVATGKATATEATYEGSKDCEKSVDRGEESGEEGEGEGEETGGADHSDGEARDSAREIFYDDLYIFTRARGISVDERPAINGTQIDLFDLFQAVDRHDGEELINWIEIGNDLGLPPSEETGSVLEDLWETYLVDFLEAMDNVETQEGDARAQETDEVEEGVEEAGTGASNVNSSPPTANKKRVADEEPNGPSKRRKRHDRNAEIPSTPDYETKRVPVSAKEKPRPATPPSRCSSNATPRPGQGSGVHTPARQILREESTYDITPSQQLFYEAINTSGGAPASQDDNEDDEVEVQQIQPLSRPRLAGPKRKGRRTLPATFASQPRPLQQPLPPVPPRQDHLPRVKPSKNPTTTAPKSVEDWIDHYVSMSYPAKIVRQALFHTTLTPGYLATLTMQSLVEGGGVPSHVEGIWTKRDDEGLRRIKEFHGTDGRTLTALRRETARLVDKHRSERLELRWKFLKSNDRLDMMAKK